MKSLFSALLLWSVAALGHTADVPTPAISPEQVVRELWQYLAAHDHPIGLGADHRLVIPPDIGADAAAQQRWLCRGLRESLQRANAYIRRTHPRSGGVPIGEITGADFRFGWDPPEKFMVTETIKGPYTAIVAGQMIWTPRQQYAGSKRKAYFVMALEEGDWRVADIQADKYKFDQSKSSFKQRLDFYR